MIHEIEKRFGSFAKVPKRKKKKKALLNLPKVKKEKKNVTSSSLRKIFANFFIFYSLKTQLFGDIFRVDTSSVKAENIFEKNFQQSSRKIKKINDRRVIFSAWFFIACSFTQRFHIHLKNIKRV